VDETRATWKVSQRRACGVLCFAPKSYRYRSRRRGQAILEARIKERGAARIRYGYRRVHILLRREGWAINHTRTRRRYNDLVGAPDSTPRPNLDVHDVKERGATGAVVIHASSRLRTCTRENARMLAARG
jgi:transposase InsO family protein